jgi:hypothetical protein
MIKKLKKMSLIWRNESICIFVIFGFFTLPIQADVRSTSGNIDFKLGEMASMNLSMNGLAIGIASASANLHVNGNAIILGQLGIGVTPNSNLTISGTMGQSFKTLSANGSIGDTSIVFADTSTAGGNINLTLPYASNVQGRLITIKKTDNQHVVTLSHGGVFDNAYSSILMSSSNIGFPYVKLISSGNIWYILQKSTGSGNDLVLDASKISNCVMWLDASDATTITQDGSGNVTQWRDKSGRGLLFSQSTSGAHPSVTSSWKNGKAAITFDPETQEYIRSTANLNFKDAGFTIFMVYENNTTSTDLNASIFMINGTSNPTLWMVTKNINGQTSIATTHAGGGSSTGVQLNSSLATPYLSTSWFDLTQKKKMLTIHGVGSISKIDSDDANIGLALQTNSTDAWIGCQKINGGTGPKYRSFGGNVGEIIMYDRKLEDEEMTAIENSLKTKWGL